MVRSSLNALASSHSREYASSSVSNLSSISKIEDERSGKKESREMLASMQWLVRSMKQAMNANSGEGAAQASARRKGDLAEALNAAAGKENRIVKRTPSPQPSIIVHRANDDMRKARTT